MAARSLSDSGDDAPGKSAADVGGSNASSPAADAEPAESVVEHIRKLREMKVMIQFSAIGSAPNLRQTKFSIAGSSRFQQITDFMKKALKTEVVYLYCNNAFCPSPDENIADLYACFRVGNHLNLGYSLEPAFA